MSNEQQKSGAVPKANPEAREAPGITKTESVAGGKTELGKSFRDWGAFALSTLAFAISAAGFYLNLVVTDDVRLIIPGEGGAFIGLNKDDTLPVQNAGNAVLANAGNRTAVIVGYEYAGTFGKDGDPKDCRNENEMSFPDDKFKPLVIRPGEAVSFALGVPSLPGKYALTPEGGDTLVVCLRFYIATPSEEPAPVDVVFVTRHISGRDKRGRVQFDSDEDLSTRTKSVRATTLVKTSHLHGG